MPKEKRQSNIDVWETLIIFADDPRWIEAERELILLRHNIFRLYLAGCAPQQGHRGKFFMIALIKRTRRVAIEFAI